jgi:cytoskeleton protein RodZ
MLRERRQELRLDIDEVGEILRIKPAFLSALEENRPQELPGPTYVIGFVRAYARHLGLDHDWVLARYKAEAAGVGARPDLALPMPLGERSVPGGPILLVALILAICGYGTWYYLSTGERSRPERVAAVPPIMQPQPEQPATPAADTTSSPVKQAASSTAPASSVANQQFSSGLFPGSAAATTSAAAAPPAAEPGGTGAAPKSLQPEPAGVAPAAAAPAGVTASASAPQGAPPQTAMAAPQPAAAPAVPGSGSAAPTGRIEIKASADCWVQVRAPDQSIVFSRVLKAGETYRVPARPGLVMRTGNAGALSIVVDGKPAPSIGPLGTLRRNVVLDPDALIGGTAVQG